jgi:hypothetical protein
VSAGKSDLVKEMSDVGSAIFSKDRRYRYQLTRFWAKEGERIVWIMLNPSVANASENDPTITRCVGFSKSFGAASMVVVNLFALRATNPKKLLEKPAESVGPDNARILSETLQDASRVVAAWGALSSKLWAASLPSREVIRKNGVHCLGKTKSGAPRHPLYLKADSPLFPWP